MLSAWKVGWAERDAGVGDGYEEEDSQASRSSLRGDVCGKSEEEGRRTATSKMQLDITFGLHLELLLSVPGHWPPRALNASGNHGEIMWRHKRVAAPY